MAYYSYLWKIDKTERDKYLSDQNAKSTGSDTSITAALTASNKTDYFAYVESYVVPEKEAKKTKYGMLRYEPYWLKNYQLRTAPMENLLAPKKEEKPTIVDIGEFVAADFTDSLGVADSTAVVVTTNADPLEDSLAFDDLPVIAQLPPPPPKKETVYLYGYDPKDELLNVEQAYYNYYFGKQLYTQRAPKPPTPPEVNNVADTAQVTRGLKGFLNRKKPVDETPEPIIPEPVTETPVEGNGEN